MDDRAHQRFNQIEAIRTHAEHYYTNAYLNSQQLLALLNAPHSAFYAWDSLAAVTYRDNGVRRCACFAGSVEHLSRIPALPESEPVLFEAVGTAEQLDDITAALSAERECPRYARLVRMTCRTAGTSPPFTGLHHDHAIQRAEPGDIPELLRLLSGVFDRNISHLPDEAALHGLIDEGGVLICRDSGKGSLAAALLVKQTGKYTCYIYQVAVADGERGKGYASSLLKARLGASAAGIVYSLWAGTENQAALRLYEKLGFRPTAQFTDIYLLKPEKTAARQKGASQMNEIYDMLNALHPEIDFRSSTNYIEDGFLDSLDVVSLVTMLEDYYKIIIDGLDILPENFISAGAIAGLIRKSGGNADL